MPSRGSADQRGYGHRHRQLRKQLASQVETGTVKCWRCRQLIHRGEPWDLGHDDVDRSVYRGPEHVACNRSHGAARPDGRENTAGRWVPAQWL